MRLQVIQFSKSKRKTQQHPVGGGGGGTQEQFRDGFFL